MAIALRSRAIQLIGLVPALGANSLSVARFLATFGHANTCARSRACVADESRVSRRRLASGHSQARADESTLKLSAVLVAAARIPTVVALEKGPTVVAHFRDKADFFGVALSDVTDPQIAGRRIEGPRVWVTQNQRPDLGSGSRSIGERIVGWNAVRVTVVHIDSRELTLHTEAIQSVAALPESTPASPMQR